MHKHVIFQNIYPNIKQFESNKIYSEHLYLEKWQFVQYLTVLVFFFIDKEDNSQFGTFFAFLLGLPNLCKLDKEL